jgi:hypothetical protein
MIICLALGGVPAAVHEADWREESAATSTVEGVDQQLGIVHRLGWDFDDARLDGDVTYTGNLN